MKKPIGPISLALCLAAAACSQSQSVAEPQPSLEQTDASSGLQASDLKLTFIAEAEFPWGMTFLPSGDLLFTEKENGLKLLPVNCIDGSASCDATSITGLPPALTANQAGYLGLALDPAYESNQTIYVAYSKGTEKANATTVVKGTLDLDAGTLSNVTEIFEADTRGAPAHFGSRIQFEDEDTLFVSLGEAYIHMKDAQTPTNTHGTLVRINSDGSIPSDNPFADGENGHPAVWSYGHRNIQGLHYDTESGELFETEHGPRGGDELNLVQKGKNYGWPKITYGINYDGTIISDKTEMEGMEQPLTYWVPSIAPAGLTRITSDVYEGWKGDLIAGGMNGPEGLKLVRIDMEDGKVVGRTDLFTGEYPIRDVIEGPDGRLYIATKNLDGIFRVDIAP